MKIAIIGAAGNMGSWLVRHFTRLSHTIIASDINRNEISKINNLEIALDNESAVREADVVVIAVPLTETANVIRSVGPKMKKNAILCEIASIKSEAIKALLETISSTIKPLSIHPLFGPGTTSLRKRIAVIPIHDMAAEVELTKALFPHSEIIVVDDEQHDRVMAVTLSIPYFVNLVVASILKDEDVTMLQKLGGTTFALQFVLTGSIMAHSPRFHTALHIENQHSLNILRGLLSNAETELTHLESGDLEAFEESYKNIKNILEAGVDLQSKYHEMYRMLDVLNNLNHEEVGL